MLQSFFFVRLSLLFGKDGGIKSYNLDVYFFFLGTGRLHYLPGCNTFAGADRIGVLQYRQ